MEINAVVVSGLRSPFVKSFGVFKDMSTLELFARVCGQLVQSTDVDPAAIDGISCGAVIPQTSNPNIARDAVMMLRLGDHVHGYTINRACISSLHTIADAARSVTLGEQGLVLAGGVECLSDVPITYSKEARNFLLTLSKAKTLSAKIALLTKFKLRDWMPKAPALAEPMTGLTMGEHAELMAKINSIGREEQDLFALQSHQRAAAAQNFFSGEICPIWPSPHFGEGIVSDNVFRADTTIEALSKLKPAFDRKFGTITAGNASPLTDGAAVCLIAHPNVAKKLGLQTLARIRDFCFVGVQPNPELLLGPALAIPMLLERNGLAIADIDLFEIHEAFAAQVQSCLKVMRSEQAMQKHFKRPAFGEIPPEKLNLHGGAIAIGHPFGATGARLVTTLSRTLAAKGLKRGCIAICASGGMAGAMLIERTDIS